MFCTVCGNELNENDQFCPVCGANVAQINNPDYQQLQQQSVYADNQQQVQQEYADYQQLQQPENADYQQLQQPENADYQQLQQPENADYQQLQQSENAEYQQPEEEKTKAKLNTRVIFIAAMLTVVVAMIIGITIVFIIGKKKEVADNGTHVRIGGQTTEATTENGDGTGALTDQLKASMFSVNVYSAEGEANTEVEGVSVSFYSGSNNTSGDPAYVIGDAANSELAKSKKLEDGEYTIVVSAEGYYGCTSNINVKNGESVDVFLTPRPQAGTIVYRVDWFGYQDLDLCAFNATDRTYVSIGSNSDSLGTYVSHDNSADKGFELLFLPQADTDDVRTIYVVDSQAAKNGTESSMERDGVRVTAYDSNGELYSLEADTNKNEPVWNAGYVHDGRAYKDSVDYLAECDTTNKWSQYMKEGQSARISEKVIELNSDGYAAIPTYNPEVENYATAERSGDKSWDMTVFYALEEEHDSPGYVDKNLCTLKKLQVRNAITGNIVDVDIYINPITNVPNKIVTIEYVANGIDVYEYYYENSGKVSFIFKYHADNYVSTYATVSKVGERYLFCDDSLVTWRIVKAGNSVENYCYGNAEKQRLSEGSWNKKSIKEYNTLNESLRAQYDENEKKMLNYAYNTYFMAMNTEAIGRIVGVLYKGNYEPCPNVDVDVYDSSFEKVIYTVKTDENGEYCVYVPVEEYTYNLRVKGSTTDNSCDVYNIQISNSVIVFYVDAAFYFETESEKQDVELYIGNAFEGYGSDIADAEIYVRRGINNRRGEKILISQTDAYGYVRMLLYPGVYTIEACKAGYESIFYTIIANPYYSNKYEYYTPPELSEGEYAIVLSWGQYPYDIDSHLFTSGNGNSDHVWYRKQYDTFGSYLDVDDTESYGPETITIRAYDQSFYYKYCVVDYSNSSAGHYSSTDMSFSNATVNVYSAGGHVATYHVPVNRQGVVWEVFEIRNGVLTPIQRYYNYMDNQSWWMN